MIRHANPVAVLAALTAVLVTPFGGTAPSDMEPTQQGTVVSPAVVDVQASMPVVSTSVVTVAYKSSPKASTGAGDLQAAIDNAKSKVGASYRWGATGPGAFDCSGLVYWAYNSAGFHLPRTSRAMSRIGTPVSMDELQPGDLVLYYRPVRHVGIYMGGGQILQASTDGEPVDYAGVYEAPFPQARRLV